MYIIMGRGGVAMTLFGMFALLTVALIRLMIILLAVAVGIIYLSGLGIRALYRRYKQKKFLSEMRARGVNPPGPTLSEIIRQH